MSTGKKLAIIKDILGSHYKSKNELLFTCPKCNHHKRKLSVNVEKDVFKCWVCDYSGRSLQRLVRRYGDYNQRIEWKALTSNVDVLSFSDELFSAKEDEKPQEVTLPEEYVCLANRNLPLDSVYARRYLKDRGITKADILKWKIGYCSTGKFAGRVIIPSFGLPNIMKVIQSSAYTFSLVIDYFRIRINTIISSTYNLFQFQILTKHLLALNYLAFCSYMHNLILFFH